MGISANPRGLEAMSVRRAKIVDGEKVRYRVYSTATEFVAVIAESALMAVKVAGINEPYRIMRDLPTVGIATEAEKIAQNAEGIEQVSLPTTAPKQTKASFRTEMKSSESVLNERFTPMKLRDLSKKDPLQNLVIPHTVLNQLIEEMQKKKAAEATSPAPPPAPKVEVAAPLPPPPEVKEEVPSPPPVAAAPAPEKTSEEVLSPEQVENLLKN